MIRAVVVDVGGVLEHTPPTGWIERWESRLGLQAGDLAAIVSPLWQPGRVGRASLEEIEARTADVLGLESEEAAELWSDVWGEYLGAPNQELLEFLDPLRTRWRTAILSNSFVGAREREQSRYGFQDRFDLLVYSHEVGIEKRHSRIYELACELLGVEPEEAVFVDDVEKNVAAAQRMGMHGVLFTDTRQDLVLAAADGVGEPSQFGDRVVVDPAVEDLEGGAGVGDVTVAVQIAGDLFELPRRRHFLVGIASA